MKKVIMAVIAVYSISSIASPLTLNVSAQNSQTCTESVKMFTDLVLGKKNSSVKIIAKKTVHGECDGETCNPDSKDFKVIFKDGNIVRSWMISTSGPDRADRCLITRQ